MRTRDKILLISLLLLSLALLGLFVYLWIVNQGKDSGDGDTPPTLNDVRTRPPIPESPGSVEKVRLLTSNPVVLDGNDEAAMSALVGPLGGSGVVYSSPDVRLEYIAPADSFHGVILTPNISVAKNEVRDVFLGAGMSAQGICKLKLFFYIDPAVAQSLSNQGIVFNPLLDGC